MTDYLEACVKKLTNEQIWQRQGAHENAVGNALKLKIAFAGSAVIKQKHGTLAARKKLFKSQDLSAIAQRIAG